MLTIKQFYFNDLRECTYVVSDPTNECIIIDPGMFSNREKERVASYISENQLKPQKILLTHGHFDHVMGCDWCMQQYNIPLYIHKADKGVLANAQQTCAMFGYSIKQPTNETFDLIPGEYVTFGESKLLVISTPGHTWGSVCLYSEADNICFTGDTLFAGNCGRTDLPEGDNGSMCNSLTKVLVNTLPPECEIYSGHGVNTTMAEELKHNPYLVNDTWIGYDE